MNLREPVRTIELPEEKPELVGLEPGRALEFVAHEYAALRGEILTALASQAAILSFGAAAVGLLVAGGAQLWDQEAIAAGLLYLMGVPAMCLLSVVLFLGEQIRLTRVGYYLFRVEAWVNRVATQDAPILGWEHWGSIRRRGGDLEQRTRWVVSGVFTLLAVGTAVTGFLHVHTRQPGLAIVALAVSLVGSAVTVLWARSLASWVRYYRALYLDRKAERTLLRDTLRDALERIGLHAARDRAQGTGS